MFHHNVAIWGVYGGLATKHTPISYLCLLDATIRGMHPKLG
jgi:hypothetical protein